MNKNRWILLIIIGLIWSVSASAATINFKGLVQNWFSLEENGESGEYNYGFTNRRLRFVPYGTLSDKVKWEVLFYWDKGGTPSFYDAFLDLSLSDQLGLKIGKFPAPGSISGALSKSKKLDLIERAPITMTWGGYNKLHGYRAFGVSLYGELIEKQLTFEVMVANPSATRFFSPTVKESQFPQEENGMAFWGRLESKPMKGLSIGAFFGSTSTTDTQEIETRTTTYGAHIFFKKDNINLKMEYIAGKADEIEYDGFYGILGVKLSQKVEAVFRYDYETPVKGSEKFTNLTAGINYWYGSGIKLQANYVLRNEESVDINNNIFYINFQYSFNIRNDR